MELSLTGLTVMRAVVDHGSFSAAASALGYTQSAVSRQVATLEKDTGGVLFDRGRTGVRLTARGLIVLRHARVVLGQLDAMRREVSGADADVHEVRVGVYVSGAVALVPRLVRTLRSSRPDIAVMTREGTTPALVRSVRAGTLDLAVVTARPPFRPVDDGRPRLVETVADESSLRLAVCATGRFAGRDTVAVDELEDVGWIDSPSSGREPLMGVWPGLGGRPRVVHQARDWLAKLHLVAADCGVTTAPPNLAGVLPDGVRLVTVEGAPAERRRVLVVHLPGRRAEPVSAVLDTLLAVFPRGGR